MDRKLTWQEIEGDFPNQWVELVDYDWDMTQPNPQSGIVRHHSKERKELSRLIRTAEPVDSAVVYVGKLTAPAGMSFSANLWPVK